MSKNLYTFLFVSILLFSANFISSQALNDAQLDEAFLKSLPDDISSDILKEVENQKLDDMPTYRRPSSKLDKSKTMQAWLKYLEESDKDIDERYGAKIFKTMQSSFMPINEPNFDGSYILDFGDVLEIQVVGQEENLFEIDIKRDGSINIPDFGKINISGLSLSKADQLISDAITSTFIGTKVFVTLKNIRDIQVLISGSAYSPGIYTLNGNSNVLHALNMSGGIAEDGSYREILLKRDGNTIETIDLYDFFIKGIFSINHKLRSGDVIYINPVNSLVRISGGVKKPGLYELAINESLGSLLDIAGGFSQLANKTDIRFEEFIAGDVTSKRIDEDNFYKIVPTTGSSVFINEFKYSTVKITGAVRNPGTYTLSKNEKLSQLIIRAGGYLDNSFPMGGVLLNEKAKEIELRNNEQSYKNLVSYIASSVFSGKSTANPDGAAMGYILQEFKNIEPIGRLQAEFDLMSIKEDMSKDTFLDHGDKIHIPSFSQQVYVFGEVANTGAIRFDPSANVKDYIEMAGGVTVYSDKSNAYIVYPSGSSKAISNNRLFSSNNIDIYPGTVIYIPKNLARYQNLEGYSLIAPIFSSLALSIASLKSLSD